MESLQASFAAGSLTWVRHGPSHHAQRLYEQVKVGVLLGTTTARWRLSAQHPWRRLPARSFCVCLGDVGAEADLAGEGQMLTLFLEREYLGKRWAVAPDAERRRYDVSGASDPYLFHLGAEAAARLRREQALSPRYVESLAHLVSVHVREHPRLGENLPLAALAAVAGVSTSHFARVFRQSVGETPHRFLVRQRVEHARKLLRAGGGKMNLGEAAFQAGFSSQSHLTRCFRAVCGLTPGEFLRKERPRGART